MGVKTKNCVKKHCERIGAWKEALPGGEAVFCFRTRHDGRIHIQKYTLEEIAQFLNQSLDKITKAS